MVADVIVLIKIVVRSAFDHYFKIVPAAEESGCPATVEPKVYIMSDINRSKIMENLWVWC